MSGYLVFICPRCGSLRYAREDQKTAKCLLCDYSVSLNFQKTRILARVKNAKEAVAVLQDFKMKLKSRNQI